MGDIIDFMAKHNEREEKKRVQALQRYIETQCSFQQPEKIDALVDERVIDVKKRSLFMALLAILKERQIEPFDIFKDAIEMDATTFETTYLLKWWSVVQLAFTFLAILKEHEPQMYASFLGLTDSE
ncbi:2-oxoglutarate ferredoxin oxidoreductase subunit beta [Lysinibacillus piscis]|uniref:Uncharacterized protein n=1 Tax=Lysinibacillus piscis TaxID=2518931 RepID=A0ABQ5NFY6_9BACI|nr:2-oxoglutarate ferredoxin oxidoreductase subunit beta [Lysinibacillus sp. KH24]GLC87296.1 hypothetical protein LYSBPC_04230 [Lysinibacillus sp. KH24]